MTEQSSGAAEPEQEERKELTALQKFLYILIEKAQKVWTAETQKTLYHQGFDAVILLAIFSAAGIIWHKKIRPQQKQKKRRRRRKSSQ